MPQSIGVRTPGLMKSQPRDRRKNKKFKGRGRSKICVRFAPEFLNSRTGGSVFIYGSGRSFNLKPAGSMPQSLAAASLCFYMLGHSPSGNNNNLIWRQSG
jgi:hypothetical protein